MLSDDQMPQEYVVNGSRFQAKIFYGQSETDESNFTVVDIGDEFKIPRSAKKLKINLIQRNAEPREILRVDVNDGKDCDTSIIITEEGTIECGQRSEANRPSSDWKWKSSSHGTITNHRPREFFVANASGEEIMLEPMSKADDSTYFNDRIVHVKHRDTGTVVGRSVRITVKGSGEVVFEGTVRLRTSLVVCSENMIRRTGRLYGEDIEAQKWIVDGENYKPKTIMEKVTEFMQWKVLWDKLEKIPKKCTQAIWEVINTCLKGVFDKPVKETEPEPSVSK